MHPSKTDGASSVTQLVSKCLLFLSLSAFSAPIKQSYEFARATGMGNAFIALADDANAIFYNPAGLARVKGFHAHLIDLGVNFDSSDTLSRLSSAASSGSFNNLIKANEKEYLGFGFKPTFIAPYVGLSFFDYGYAYFDVNGPTSNQKIDAFAYNDMGAALAFGIPVGNHFSVGLGVRAVRRTAIEVDKTPEEIQADTGITLPELAGNPYGKISGAYTGVGFGLPIMASAMFTVPKWSSSAPMARLAVTYENIGNTSYQLISGSTAPNPTRASLNFGSLLQYELSKLAVLNVTMDLRHQMEGLPFLQTLHFGTEYRHRIFGLRAGLYQGNLSYGFSLEFPPHTRLHFSSYRMALSDASGGGSQPVYQLQFVIGFSPL